MEVKKAGGCEEERERGREETLMILQAKEGHNFDTINDIKALLEHNIAQNERIEVMLTRLTNQSKTKLLNFPEVYDCFKLAYFFVFYVIFKNILKGIR